MLSKLAFLRHCTPLHVGCGFLFILDSSEPDFGTSNTGNHLALLFRSFINVHMLSSPMEKLFSGGLV